LNLSLRVESLCDELLVWLMVWANYHLQAKLVFNPNHFGYGFWCFDSWVLVINWNVMLLPNKILIYNMVGLPSSSTVGRTVNKLKNSLHLRFIHCSVFSEVAIYPSFSWWVVLPLFYRGFQELELKLSLTCRDY
jgi:predicted Co/Zn/Cd cation transporter (cation efflux family)